MAARAEASERLADQIVEGLTSGLVVVDRARHGAGDQPRGAAHSRARREGDRHSRFASAEARHRAGRPDRRSARRRRRRSSAARSRWAASRPRHLGVTVSPIVGADGALQAAVCLFTDLTAVVELEEQLRLKEALARLGELTAGLAHEFRNGLATIHGYGRLLDPADAARSGAHLRRRHSRRNDRARRSGHQLPALRASRAADDGAGRSARGDRARDRRCARCRAGRGARRQLRDGRMATMCCCGGRSATCSATASKRARTPACRRAFTCAATSPTSDAHVVVEDNGPGFTPEYLSKAFQPFATTKANGTGLGLAIVQKVIVSHNGHITAAQSSRGRRAVPHARSRLRARVVAQKLPHPAARPRVRN